MAHLSPDHVFGHFYPADQISVSQLIQPRIKLQGRINEKCLTDKVNNKAFESAQKAQAAFGANVGGSNVGELISPYKVCDFFNPPDSSE
jgi:hypothetical protein